MLKRIISMLVLSAFAMNVVFILPVLAGHRIQDRGGGTVTLEARDNDIPENATGTAKFENDKDPDGVNRVKVTVDVENLPKRAQRVYQVWLVNDGGTDLNLTAFNTDNDGDATVSTTRNIINLAPYDSIKVNTKRIESFSTSRGGDTVLSGLLHRNNDGDDFDDNGDDFDDHGDEFDDDSDNNGDDFDDDNGDFDDHGDEFDDDFDDNGDDFDDHDDETQRERQRRQQQENN